MADAPASGAGWSNPVEVQILSSAPTPTTLDSFPRQGHGSKVRHVTPPMVATFLAAAAVGCWLASSSEAHAQSSGARSAGRTGTNRGTGSREQAGSQARGGVISDAPTGPTRIGPPPTPRRERAWSGRPPWWPPILTMSVPHPPSPNDKGQNYRETVTRPASSPLTRSSAEPSSIKPLQTLQPPQAKQPSAVGTLELEIGPNTAQVYVDGFYVGTVEDSISAAGLSLAVGWHRLEFRASGYQTSAANVTIEADHTARYRSELKRIDR